MMSDLENSISTLDRQKYAAFLKQAIDNCNYNIHKLFSQNEVSEYEKELIKKEIDYMRKLKIKLSNYDIYNQSVPYVCGTCNEKECACHFAGIHKMEETPIIEELPPEITQEDLSKFGI